LKKILGKLKIYGIILFGAWLAAIGVSLFLTPAQMVAGGLSGIGIIVNSVIGLPVGTFVLLINIPLFLTGYKTLGADFFWKSLLGALVFSILTDLMALWPPITENLFLCAIFGGGLLGVGIGLILLQGATTGGTDIVAELLCKSVPLFSIGKWILILDAGIVLLAGIVFHNWESCLYDIIATIIAAITLELVIQRSDLANIVYIISHKSQAIAEDIVSELGRSVTAFTMADTPENRNVSMVMCVIHHYEIVKLEKIIKRHDVNSFIIFSTAHQVVGKGFKTYSIN